MHCCFRGSAEATRQAHALITALITDPDKELTEIIPKAKQKPPAENKSMYFIPPTDTLMPITGTNTQSSGSSLQKSSNKTLAPRLQQSAAVCGNNARSVVPGQSGPNAGMVWGSSPAPGSVSPRRNTGKAPAGAPYSVPSVAMNGPLSVDKSNVTRQLFTGVERRGGFGSPNTATTVVTMSNVTGSIPASPPTFNVRQDGRLHHNRGRGQGKLVPGTVKLLQRPGGAGTPKHEPQSLPLVPNQSTTTITTQTITSANTSLNMSSSGEFSPFDNFFSNAAEQLLGKKEDNMNERMNFASVAAAGVVPTFSGSTVMSPEPHSPDPALQAKAPGFKLQQSCGPRMMAPPDMNPGFRAPGFPMPLQMMDMNMPLHGLQGFPGFMGPPLPQPFPNHSPDMSPRSSQSSTAGLSPRSNSSGFDPQMAANQKEEYTTPNQPMTLPKINSSLNPNAPDFTSRSVPGGTSFPGGPPNFPNAGFQVPPMYQQELAKQLLSVFNNMGPGQGNLPAAPTSPVPGQDPLSGMSTNPQEFYQNMANLVHQFTAVQNQPPGSPGLGPGFTPPAVPRPFSPLPVQGRPSSAPSVGGMLPRGKHHRLAL